MNFTDYREYIEVPDQLLHTVKFLSEIDSKNNILDRMKIQFDFFTVGLLASVFDVTEGRANKTDSFIT